MATVRLTEADTSRRAVLSPGDVAELRVPENPTTGFRWHAEIDPPSRLALEGDDVAPSGAVPGGGGVRVFRYRAVLPGPATIRLKLWRDWEGEASVTSRLEFVLEVRDDAERQTP